MGNGIIPYLLDRICNIYIFTVPKDTVKEVAREAKVYHDLNIQYRKWVARVGGVYISTEKVTPNPHLTVPDRDVTTGSGKPLTLVNPAYMTRMIFDVIRNESKPPIINRIVSLKPLNPLNEPNPWEIETLKLFENSAVRERGQLLTIGDEPFFQFMAAFMTDESCLKCHAHQGYKVGDIRGGMSIAIPMSGYLALEAERRDWLAGGFALLWFLGVSGITVSSTRRHSQHMALRTYTEKLEQEIEERQRVQQELEEQAIMLEEEGTERQQAVAALEKAEQFLHTIIESEPECVKLLDPDCNLLMMNRAGLEMIGADTFEQVKGHCVCPLVCEPYRHSFKELTRNAFQGLSGELEFEVVGLKGRRVWMHTVAVPFRDEQGTIVALLGITRNITALKDSAEALRASEERFRGIAESLADWIWEIDAAGRFTFSSESSLRLLGYAPEEITGKTVYEFIDSQDVERVRRVLEENVADRSAIKNLEHWKITRDGRRVCLLSNGVPIVNLQGDLVGYRGVDSDVTEQRTLERQASQQQKLESVGLLAGGIAHDFNNLLVPIFGYAEMVNKRHASDEKTVSYMNALLKAALQAKVLVSRLLSFSRKQPVKHEILDLNEVITSIMMILKRTIRENIAISLQLSFEPCRILADRTQIEQSLLNLAVNAQDAIAGTGEITIETGHLLFDREYCQRHPGIAPGRYVMIAFSDSGCGIDEAALPFIFDPFFTTKPPGRGTGLGLSSLFGVVKQHGGSVTVDSRSGVGTTFTLYLPEKSGEGDAPEHKPAVGDLEHRPGTILVVEDDPMVLAMVREILEGIGHRVLSADVPSQALDIVQSSREPIDLLVSDVIMPQMNGPELFQRVIELLPKLQVLFMSGYAGTITEFSGQQGEKSNFIAKPFTMEAFLRKVAEVMSDSPEPDADDAPA